MSLEILAQGFRFHPGSLPWIHLAWLVPALLLVYLHSFYRKRLALRIFARTEVLGHLIPSVSWGRQYLKCALVLAGVLALAVGIARPQWGSKVEEIHRKGIDLVVCLDLSNSMLAEDVHPNRLEWAKADLNELLGALAGDRIGLVAFAGHAEIRCPLTFDYGFFRRILGELEVGSVSLGGTAIGKAIEKGLDCFQDEVKNHKAILLITDGEDHDMPVKFAAARAKKMGVMIFAFGLGDTGEGKRIPITDERGNRVFLKDEEGKEVWTKMNPRVLLEAATETNGDYGPDSRRGVTTVLDLYNKKIVEKVQEIEHEGTKEERYKDRYQWFLALGWVLLAMEPLLGTRRRDVEGEAAQ